MQIYNTHTSFDSRGGCVLALGSFDALHIAHQALICEAVAQARLRGVRAGVHLFDRRPETVLFPQKEFKSIYKNDDKAQIIERFGVDFVYYETFDAAFMKLDSFAFARMLKEKLGVLCVVVGFHYTFGYGGAGTAEKLKQFGEMLGFDVVVLEPIEQDGALVSSTLIRECLINGEIARANRLLGRDYMLGGPVVRDRGVGTQMGIPTANLAVPDDILLPKNGVYATYSSVGGRLFAGVTNIGVRPTFSLDKIAVETHILDFQGDIDGAYLQVYFLQRLRPEKKFDTKEELARQIFSDMDEARRLFVEKCG